MSQPFDPKDPFANFDYFSYKDNREVMSGYDLNDDGEVISIADYVDIHRD